MRVLSRILLCSSGSAASKLSDELLNHQFFKTLSVSVKHFYKINTRRNITKINFHFRFVENIFFKYFFPTILYISNVPRMIVLVEVSVKFPEEGLG